MGKAILIKAPKSVWENHFPKGKKGVEKERNNEIKQGNGNKIFYLGENSKNKFVSLFTE